MLPQNAMNDMRYALRQLRKNPGFTTLAAGTLAPGLDARITIFSWINSTLRDPIPGVAHTSDMVTIMRGERSEHPTPPFSSSQLAARLRSNQCKHSEPSSFLEILHGEDSR